MFFMRTQHFIILVLLFTGLLVSGCIASYILLTEHGDKLNAERVLFFGIIGVLLLGLMIGRLIVYNRHSIKKMDKLVDLVTRNGTLPLDRLASFGTFGKKMQHIYSEMVSLGERKSSRISQLNTVAEKIMEFVDIPLILVDATGEIRKTSRGFLEKHKLVPGEIIGRMLSDQVAGIDLNSALLNAKRSKRPVEIDHNKLLYTFYPVFSKENEVVFFLVAVGKHKLLSLPQEKELTDNEIKSDKPKKGRFLTFLKMIMGDKDKKEKKPATDSPDEEKR